MRREAHPELKHWWAATFVIAALLATGSLAAQESESVADPLRDAVGILLDNQERCLSLAYGKLDLLDGAFDAGEQNAALEHYLLRENRTRVQVAKNAVTLARRLAGRASSAQPETSESIATMRREQERLCSFATETYSGGSAATHRQQIDQQSRNFERALSTLPHHLQIGSSERLAIVRRYREELYGLDGDLSDASISRAMEEDQGIPGEAQISEKEYQRKKKAYDEWLADQERQEAEKRRRQAERRARVAERHQQAPREMPKLELNLPGAEPKGPTATPAEMAKWHADYVAKVSPFKQSLSKFLEVQGPTRTMIMLQACQDLSRAAKGVLEDATALAAPDPAAGQALRDAIGWFKQAADSCIGNRLRKTRVHISTGERSLAQAMKLLEPYGLGL